MRNDELRKAFGLIERNKDLADFEGRKEEELILLAESALGLDFPPAYREFLGEYGCGDIAGEEFYGLISSDFYNSSVPDAVWLTLEERRSSGAPHSLVVVYANGDGTYCCIECSSVNEQGESPVVIWSPSVSSAGGLLEVVAEDFGKFFLEKIQEAVS